MNESTSMSSTPASVSSPTQQTQQQQQQQQQQSQQQQQQTAPDGENLFIEANRLATFQNWPNPNISPQSLAKAGFFYLNHSDEVKCAWCKGVIAKWEKEDNAFEEHKRFFPLCPRVQLGPLIEMASDGIRDLGIQQISPPKYPKFATLDARLRSYTNWPIRDIQSPLALAQAGLYYQDVDDHVRCFHCNIGLRSWQKEDDPWHEHAKWYPQCQFVNLVKGVLYVQQVQESTRRSSSEINCAEAAASAPPMTIDEAMATPAVLHALEMGIDVGSIRTVTYRHILATGHPYTTVEDLIKAVFDDRDGEDDDVYAQERNALSEERSPSPPRDVPPSSYYHIDSSPAATPAAPVAASIEVHVPAERDVAPTIRPAPSPPAAQVPVVPQPSSAKADANEAEPPRDETGTRVAEPEKPALTLEEENRKLKDARLCKVCLDDEVGVVFLPCGHFVTCFQCAPSVNQCPMCRSSIKAFVRTYLS